MNPAPYPSDTRAKGWRFELDLEQISQSDTWALAPQDLRPWLLMLWSVSWQQVPCGSLPGEDAIIAARIGMKPAAFAKNKAVLLRGWEAADDGRLYHPTITQRVLSMLGAKQKEKDRKAAYRARMSGNVPRDNHGTDLGCDDTGTGTGTGTGIKNNHQVETPIGGNSPDESQPPSPGKPATSPRGIRLPDGWRLPKAWGEWALSENPGLTEAGVRLEADKFADHWHAKAGAEARKVDWEATWRNWIRRASHPKPQPASATLAQRNQSASDEAKRLIFGEQEETHAAG